MHHYRHEVHHPPHRDRNSNQRQKNDAAPNHPLPPNSKLHNRYYVQFACGISKFRQWERNVSALASGFDIWF
jgi:hypothetical protein